MNKISLDNILNIMEAMVQYELGLSELYETCARVSKEDEQLWRSLSGAEINHADHIKKMMAIMIEKHDRFEAGRPFNITALRTVMAGIKETIERISRGELSREKMLITARDFEQSVLESHYTEIVRTNDLEYQTLMKNVLSQTQEHKKAIQKAIVNVKTKD